MNTKKSLLKHPLLQKAKEVLEVEAHCIQVARDKLDHQFELAAELAVTSVRSGGKLVVCGVGKSGKIAAKVAATLASLGTPALYLHPTEASHGDLGVVSSNDIMLLFSYSGSSSEIIDLLPSLRRRGVKIVSIVGNTKSAIAQQSDAVLDGSVAKEACPWNLAPTSSTTVALALGDALAVALAVELEFNEENFAINHPGGALGRRLTLHVTDLMHSGAELPWVNETDLVQEVVNVSTDKKLGAAFVRNPQGRLTGVITDGDIRRALLHKDRFFSFCAADIMTRNPVSVRANEKASRALELMENRSSQIGVLPVLDETGACIGLLRLHDVIGRL
jgi:arabinose-5-phosphate isomerase